MRGLLPVAAAVLALALSGCGSYHWKSEVPKDMRTVSVPVFRNESDVTGLGSAVTRQVLREFERDATFSVRPAGDAALEVQGVVRDGGSRVVAHERKTGQRHLEHRLRAEAVVSVIDKRRGKVLVDDRKYVASTTYAGDDRVTGARDASGRLAEDFARQIVDDVLSMDFDGPGSKKGERR